MISKKIQKENLKKFLLVSNKYDSEENFKKIDKIKEIINELNSYLDKEIIDKIMQTHKDYDFGVKFLNFLELHRKHDSKTITKLLGLKNSRLIESWYRKYPPRPIRTLLTIYFNNYYKISKEDLAYLFGRGFGDGGLDSTLSYYFICGKKQDLLKIKNYLNQKMPSLPIILKTNFGKNSIKRANGKIINIYGNDSWILHMRDSSFCKLLYSLRLPKGNKVLQKTYIPNWIRKGNQKIKKAFLNSLFEGELQKHKVQYNIKKNKVEICPITFGLSKIKRYKSNLIKFLNEIRGMLEEFNIKSTKVEEPKLSNIRKDEFVTCSSRFYISTSAINTLRFYNLFDYQFNKEKRGALIKAAEEAKIKLARMSSQMLKYMKAVELYMNGLSLYKIAKKLDIQYSTAKNWLKINKHLPTLFREEGDFLAEI
jgi:flagellin-specific chaperone FliS